MDENCQTFTKTFIEIIKKCVPQDFEFELEKSSSKVLTLK
jgi:hypothetical protein